jgi:hypothetical protein
MNAAEDDEDTFVALALGRAALVNDHVKSADFFHLRLHSFTDCQFKNWLRYDFPCSASDTINAGTECLETHLSIYFSLLRTTPSSLSLQQLE